MSDLAHEKVSLPDLRGTGGGAEPVESPEHEQPLRHPDGDASLRWAVSWELEGAVWTEGGIGSYWRVCMNWARGGGANRGTGWALGHSYLKVGGERGE